jgi:hypothetical protein
MVSGSELSGLTTILPEFTRLSGANERLLKSLTRAIRTAKEARADGIDSRGIIMLPLHSRKKLKRKRTFYRFDALY